MTILMKLRAQSRRFSSLAASAALMVGSAGVASILLPSVVAPSVAAAATACGSNPVIVHYLVTPTRPPVDVSAVELTGLSAGCDGDSVKLVLRGNTAGQPAATTAAGKTTPVLSTATSAVTPCTGTKQAKPIKVATGSITLALCKTSTPASSGPYVSVHDLTHLTLTVAGVAVSPHGVVFTTGSSGQHGTAGALAFTGADIAAMAAAGVLLLALGGLLLVWERRRRDRAADSGA